MKSLWTFCVIWLFQRKIFVLQTSVLSCVFFALTAQAKCFAQYNSKRNNIWSCGRYMGVDFNSGSPVSDTSAFGAASSTASVSDTFGRLQFSTDGNYFFNRKHQLMPNGVVMAIATLDVMQPVVIVPFPSDTSKYYVFVLSGSMTDKLVKYYVVDMSLDTGYGDVSAGPFVLSSADSLSEKMISITGNHNNIWLLVHKSDFPIFHAYNITVGGIDTTPVVSVSGTFTREEAYIKGAMKVSPNRRKIVTQCWDFYRSDSIGTELYDFDPENGFVSNCVVLDSISKGFSAEFSPDNTKLYCENEIAFGNGRIYQYNLSMSTQDLVRASKRLIAINDIARYDLKLASNGKIYCLGSGGCPSACGGCYIDAINNPNLSDTSCNYQVHVMSVPPGRSLCYMFPNLVMGTDTIVASAPALTLDRSTQYSVSLFPNPVDGSLHIQASTQILTVVIYNAIGTEVSRFFVNSQIAEISVVELPTGNYWVRINDSITHHFFRK